MSSNISCYHCGLPVPPGTHFQVVIEQQPQAMCCAGCQAVAQAIMDNGLSDFYRYRTETAPTGKELVPEFLRQTEVYDNPTIQKRFVREVGEHLREAALILEGITCAACIWLNERHLRALPGVLEVQVNYTTHRAQVRWDERQIQLSQILQAITAIGYFAHPYDPARQQALLEQERKQQLRRLGVAGVMGMQVMMVAVALYAGDFYGMEAEYRRLLQWLSLLLTLPIMLYAAVPFYRNAWRDLRHWQVSMDVPVALGITLAFLGSVWVTWQSGSGAVYYDSVGMFVFFLLTARYFELMARSRSARASEALVQMVPAMAARLRLDESGQSQEDWVAVADLLPGDRVLLRPGDSIPADGVVLTGRSSVDESLLTGESLPLLRTPGDRLTAGTVNIESPLQMQVEKIGADTLLSHILRLLERAQSEKPYLTQLADRTATWFVLAVLILAGLVAWYWWQHDPSHWLAITLSVLVVTCPCALSLATPAAITAATGTLTQHGLLTTRGHALETLARTTHVVFDKTGTLTDGRLRLLNSQVFSALTLADCLHYAAALESHSEHPLAKALLEAAKQQAVATSLAVENLSNQPGAGIQGDINGQRWWIGTADFVQTQTGLHIDPARRLQAQTDGHSLVWLAERDRLHAVFMLGDDLRPGAAQLVADLKTAGCQVLLLTGDHQHSAARIAEAVGITDYAWQLTPDDKLARVKALQAAGAVVAMIGDGVNDAPVLGQAQVSIAMGGGTQAARASADMILLSEDLSHLRTGLLMARKTLRIIRQNLAWAALYNLLALPAAALGYVAPWMAAIGMSASSLLVVLNALRLVEREQPRQKPATADNRNDSTPTL